MVSWYIHAISLTHPRSSGNESFVFKRVSKPFYELSQRLAAEFAGTRRLRMHTDCNQEQRILVYPYFRDTLLGLIKDDSEVLFPERKKILRRVGEAIQELHRKEWIHIGTIPVPNCLPDLSMLTMLLFLADIKPDNMLVNWTCDKDGPKTVTDVALGDFDIAFKSEGGKPRQTPYAIGNAMWRSPEGQTGRGVTKASDMYSFGLVVS